MSNYIPFQRYQEAEAAFQIVLKLDADCPDAQFELAKVRVRILTVRIFFFPNQDIHY